MPVFRGGRGSAGCLSMPLHDIRANSSSFLMDGIIFHIYLEWTPDLFVFASGLPLSLDGLLSTLNPPQDGGFYQHH